MKKTICLILSVFILIFPMRASANEKAEIYPYDTVISEFWFEEAAAEYKSNGEAKALLLMEFSTGRVLFAENETEHLPLASVTKVISTLLIVEAIDEGRITLQDTVVVSEYAASMGGSQIFLEAGEEMSVEDLLKSLVVASANDATVALAEHLYGSEETFVQAMNDKARSLGCENSNFVNTNGLPAENHYSCALDIAIITRELMKHEMIFNYTTIWMDTIRNGSFGLANTNKLVRFYKGATGMKTGFTDEAKYCLSGTAERDGMQLIAVVLGAETSNARFSAAKGLLDYGFANYSVVNPPLPELQPITVTRGVKKQAKIEAEQISLLSEKGDKSEIETKYYIAESVTAPITAGQEVGYVSYLRNGEEIARSVIKITESVDEISYKSLICEIFRALLFKYQSAVI